MQSHSILQLNTCKAFGSTFVLHYEHVPALVSLFDVPDSLL